MNFENFDKITELSIQNFNILKIFSHLQNKTDAK